MPFGDVSERTLVCFTGRELIHGHERTLAPRNAPPGRSVRWRVPALSPATGLEP